VIIMKKEDVKKIVKEGYGKIVESDLCAAVDVVVIG